MYSLKTCAEFKTLDDFHPMYPASEELLFKELKVLEPAVVCVSTAG